jgi:hypothetical protein
MENWHWSIQVVFVLAALLSVASLAVATGDRPRGRVIATLLAILASFTLGAGLAVFPALAVVALAQRRRAADLGVILAGALLCAVVYLLGTAEAAGEVAGVLSRPAETVTFMLRYLGPPFMQDRHKLPIGALLVVLGLAAVATGLLRGGRGRLCAFCLGLVAFGLGTALLTALARSGFGEPASSRYGAFSTLFWTGLIGLIAAASQRPRLRPLRWALYAALGYGIFVFPVMATQRAAALPFIARADDSTDAALSAALGMPDPAAIRAHLHPDPALVTALVPYLQQQGYGMFGWAPLRAPGTLLDAALRRAAGTCPARIETAAAAGGRRLTGSFESGAAPQWLLVADGDGVVRGLAVRHRLDNGFSGYVRGDGAATVWGLTGFGALCRAGELGG